MIDPPRDEARDAVARAKGAGIRPIMITGDHPKTAAVIAAELGIAPDGRAVTGAELEKMPEEVLDRTVQDVSVYARINPEHKLRIVKALQRDGMIVAMTGDGVNDAPALKTADIGVAMGITGTDVSKEAADMVLADDNFASIVAAVEEGRAIFSNIRKFLRYLLSSNIGEVMTMFFGVLLAEVIGLTAAGSGGVVLPLLATQILWINLVTDGAPALALGVDPADADDHETATAPARRRRDHASDVGRHLLCRRGDGGRDALCARRLTSWWPDRRLRHHAYAQTMAFTTLVMFQLFNVFNARSDERSAFSGLFENHWLWAAIGLSLLLHAAVIHTPVPAAGVFDRELESRAIGCTARRWQARCCGCANWARPLYVPARDQQLGSKAKSSPWGTAGRQRASARELAPPISQFCDSGFSRREPQPAIPWRLRSSTSTR